MGRTLDLLGSYDHRRVDELARAVRAWEQEDGPATVDARRLTFATPIALALVGAAIDRVHGQADVELLPPASADVAAYVRRMDVLPAALREPDPSVRNRSGGFCGLQRFHDDATYPAAAQRLTEAIAHASSADRLTVAALRLCLDEILENVIHHAASATGGIAACQTWPKRHRAEVVIVDRGRGIRESLRASTSAETPADDAAALHAALTLGVTATPERNAGMGLAFSTALVLANGGDLELRSGRAVVAASVPSQARTGGDDLDGTAVRVTIRTDRPLDAAAAYAELNDLP